MKFLILRAGLEEKSIASALDRTPVARFSSPYSDTILSYPSSSSIAMEFENVSR
jgi:hypothetical protein